MLWNGKKKIKICINDPILSGDDELTLLEVVLHLNRINHWVLYSKETESINWTKHCHVEKETIAGFHSNFNCLVF